MGFHHVGQAGLELLTSSDAPDSASQSAGITGVSHSPDKSIFNYWTGHIPGLLNAESHILNSVLENSHDCFLLVISNIPFSLLFIIQTSNLLYFSSDF